MGDIFDYLSFFILSALLAVVKLTGFYDMNWWIVGAPSIFALSVHTLTLISKG